MQVVVGPDEGEGPVDGGVPPRGHERVLQPAALRGVVVNVVGGDDWHVHIVGQPCQLAIAPRVALQEVLLQLHVDRIAPEPLLVAA